MLKNNIARELQKLGKSQSRLAEVTGISKGLISQIVSGRSLPTPDELSLICGVIGQHAEQLYSADVLRIITGAEPKPKRKRNTKLIRIPEQIVEKIDRFARVNGMSRDQAAQAMILFGDTKATPGLYFFTTIEEGRFYICKDGVLHESPPIIGRGQSKTIFPPARDMCMEVKPYVCCIND